MVDYCFLSKLRKRKRNIYLDSDICDVRVQGIESLKDLEELKVTNTQIKSVAELEKCTKAKCMHFSAIPSLQMHACPQTAYALSR